jgi:hypothetical protein
MVVHMPQSLSTLQNDVNPDRHAEVARLRVQFQPSGAGESAGQHLSAPTAAMPRPGGAAPRGNACKKGGFRGKVKPLSGQRGPGTGHSRIWDHVLAERTSAMAQLVTGTIFFMDGSKVSLRWPRQAGTDPQAIAANIKKALEADRIVAEVGGSLLLIPLRNIKYIQITPTPEKLPAGVLRGAQIVS